MITTKETALNFARSILSLADDVMKQIEMENYEAASDTLTDIERDRNMLQAYVNRKNMENE